MPLGKTRDQNPYERVASQEDGFVLEENRTYEGNLASLPPRQCPREMELFYRFVSYFLLFLCLLQAFIIGFIGQKLWENKQNSLVKSPIPPIPLILRTFDSNPSMMGLRSLKEVEDAWSGYAFVKVDNPMKYSLRPNTNVISGSDNVYMPSAHHQLHCLKNLHRAYVTMANNITKLEGHLGVDHAEHCFDYLRQGITCAGDSTLEGPDPGGVGTLTGRGVVHICRAWDEPAGLDFWRKENSPP